MAKCQALSIFVQNSKIFLACRNGVYVKDDALCDEYKHQSGPNKDYPGEEVIHSDDAEDIFESSIDFCMNNADLTKCNGASLEEESDLKSDATAKEPLILVYKYKHPAVAFDLQGDYLFSLHMKTGCANKSKCDIEIKTFFIECCYIEDFTCVTACLSPFDLSIQKVPYNPWISVIPGHRVELRFIKEHYPDLFTNFPDLGNVLLLFVSYSQENVRMIAIQKTKDIKNLCDIGSAVVSLKINHPIGLFTIQKKVEGSETLNSAKELPQLIDELLSNESADLGELTATFCPSNVRQVYEYKYDGRNGPHQNGLLVLFNDGRLIQYRKAGKELHKTKLPIQSIVSFTFDLNETFYALSNSGILYKWSGPPSNIVGDVKNDQDLQSIGLVDKVLEIADSMELINMQRSRQEDLIQQLQYFGFINENPNVSEFTFDVDVEALPTLNSKSLHRLVIRVQNVGKMKFLGKFWKLLITLGQSNENDSTVKDFLQHTAKFPSFSNTEGMWTTYFDIYESLGPACLPLKLSIQLLLNLEVDSKKWHMKTNIIFRKNLSALDFVVLQSSVYPNSGNKSTIKSLLADSGLKELEAEANTDSFEGFLDSINKCRPVHSLFESREKQSNEQCDQGAMAPLFSIDIESTRIERLSKHKRFFKELQRVISLDMSESTSRCSVAQFRFLDEDLFINADVTKLGSTKYTVTLIINGWYSNIAVSKLKSDMIQCLKEDLELYITEDKSVMISFEFIKEVERLRREVETFDTDNNAANIATYKKVYSVWRTMINNLTFSLFQNKDNDRQ